MSLSLPGIRARAKALRSVLTEIPRSGPKEPGELAKCRILSLMVRTLSVSTCLELNAGKADSQSINSLTLRPVSVAKIRRWPSWRRIQNQAEGMILWVAWT